MCVLKSFNFLCELLLPGTKPVALHFLVFDLSVCYVFFLFLFSHNLWGMSGWAEQGRYLLVFKQFLSYLRLSTQNCIRSTLPVLATTASADCADEYVDC